MSVRIVIPGKPKAWARARMGNGRFFTDAKTRTAEAVVAGEAMRVFPQPLDGPVRVFVTAIFEIPKSWPKARRATARFHTSKPDGDNLMKTVLDGLNGVAFRDDAQVADQRAVKRYGVQAQTIIEVEALE